MKDGETADVAGLVDYILKNAQNLENQRYSKLGKGELTWLSNND